MEVKNKIDIRLEKYEKCFATCDIDCPLGQLYDYSVALSVFTLEKMKSIQTSQEAHKVSQEDQPEAKEA